MNKIRAKLNSRSGATIIFALTVFLIVTVISTVMVNGALSAVQNAALLQRQEKAALSGRSAAGLLERELADTGTGQDPVIFARETALDAGTEEHASGEAGYEEEQEAVLGEMEALAEKYSMTVQPADSTAQECQLWNGTGCEVYTASAVSTQHLILQKAYLCVRDQTEQTLTITDVKDAEGDAADVLPVSITLKAEGERMTALVTVEEEDTVLYKVTMVFDCEIVPDSTDVPVHYSYPDTDRNGITSTVSGRHLIHVSTTTYRWSLNQIVQGEEDT